MNDNNHSSKDNKRMDARRLGLLIRCIGFSAYYYCRDLNSPQRLFTIDQVMRLWDSRIALFLESAIAIHAGIGTLDVSERAEDMYVTDPYCSEWECWPEGRPIEHPSLDDCVASPYPHMDLPLEAYKDIPEDNTMHCPQESHQETLWRGDNVPVQYWSGSKDVMRPWRGYGMRSRNLGQITSWHVRNSATEKVNIYWVGFNGAEKLQRTLTPKDRLSVRTIQGHVFTARSTRTNELLMVHTVGARVVRNINNVQCNSTQDITGRHPETPQIGESGSDRPLNCNFITTVFRNDVDCALAAYYDTGDKEILAFEIERRRNSQDDDVERKQGGDNPAAAHYNFELTFVTHTFRFRTLQGELVEEHYIDRDYVVDCPGSKSSSSSNNNNNNVIRTQLHHSQKNKDYNNAATKPKSASSINDYDTSNVTSNNEGFSIAASSAEDVDKRDDNDDRDTTAEMHTFLIYAPGINCTECEYRSKENATCAAPQRRVADISNESR